MLDIPSRVLRFDKFILHLVRCALLRGDEVLALRRQSFDVLRYLAERPTQVVSREELIKAVWAVSPARPEDSVFQCIKDIRRALGEEARWIIRSVPGRGYTFMAEVTTVEAAPPDQAACPEPHADVQTGLEARLNEEGRSEQPDVVLPQWQRALIAASLLITVLVAGGWLVWKGARPEPPTALAMMALPSLAVLPFEALGTDPGEVSAARALYDDVTTEISGQVNARQIALKSAAAYRGGAADPKTAGRQLDARYLLVGSLRREGDELHANLRLIEAETGRQLWGESFRYAPGQRNYAVVRVAGSLGVTLIAIESQRPLPANAEAAHYTIRAVAILQSELDAVTGKEALALLEKALDLDPNSVPALLSYVVAQIAHVIHGWAPRDEHDSRLSKAEHAVDRAIKLAPRYAIAYHRRARLLWARGDPDGAIAANAHALALNPNLAEAHVSLGYSKIDAGLAHEAIAHIEEGIRLNPAHPLLFAWYFRAGQAAVHVGDYDAAVGWLQKARQANPRLSQMVPWLAVAYAGLGREDAASALIKEHLSSENKLTISMWNKRLPPRSGVLAEQRARIVATLRRLGVPEAEPGASQVRKVQTGSTQ